MTVLLPFLLWVLIQDAFCAGNITYSYTIGLLYEKGLTRKVIDASALAASSANFQIRVEGVQIESDNAFECLNSSCYVILRYPTAAIFGPTSRSNVDIIQSICTARSIPHILTDYVGPLQRDIQLSFYPDINLLADAYIDILSSMEWNQFTFIHTSEDHTPWLEFIAKAQSYGFVFNIEFMNPDVSEEKRDVIQDLKEAGTKYFVIDCLENNTMRILSLFQSYGMVTEDYHYFFTSIDTFNESISSFRSSGVDITKVQLLSPKEDDRFKAAGFSNMPTVYEALTYDAIQMFAKILENVKPDQDESVNCENGTPWRHGETLLNLIVAEKTYMGLTGNISFDSNNKYRNMFALFINKLTPSGMTEVGTWNPSYGIEHFSTQEEEIITDDWRSKPLVVITSMTEPYAMKKESVHPLQGNDRYKGFAIDLIEAISKIENFNYTIIEGQQTGSLQMSGKWTGMLGDVLTKKADLAIADITVTFERIRNLEFTHPIMHTGITILFQKPMLTPPSVWYFARPFSADFWTAIALSFVGVIISLFVVGRLCNSEWQKLNPTSNYSTSQLTFSNSIWFVAGSLFRQNTQVKIRSIPGRIIAAAWWLLCFIVIAMYIAALVSHRVKYKDDEDVLFTDVRSLVKTAEERGIRYGAKRGGATMYFFKDSTNTLYQEIYEHMRENEEDMVDEIREGVERAENTIYAFFTEETTIDYIIKNHCQLTKYGGLLNENAYSIAMRPGSPYLTPLNTAILKLLSSGKLEALKRKWWRDRGMCREIGEVDETYPVYVGIVGVIQITSIGIALAVIAAVVEFLLHVNEKRKKLKIGFLKVFKLEVKRCFKGNKKAVIDRNLIKKPIPENEEHDAIELS